MTDKKPQIEIQDPYLVAMDIVKKEVRDVKKSFNWIMTFVVGILMIGFLTLLFMVATILMDAWDFHSSVEKESIQLKNQADNITNTATQQAQILKALNDINSKLAK